MITNGNLRIAMKVPISEVRARMSPHVLGEACEAEAAPWPHYQGELRETDFKLIAPPRFGYTGHGLRKGPRYTRLPIAIVGTMTSKADETLVEARVSLTGRSWLFVIGMPIGMLLLMSALLSPIYSLNRVLFINVVSVTSGVTAVLGVLLSWLSLSLDKSDFRNVLQGHARR